MKTTLLKWLRRLAKRRFWIEYYNREYFVKERYKEENNKKYDYVLVHNIDTLDKAKEILSNKRRGWIEDVIKDKRAKIINKKLKKF